MSIRADSTLEFPSPPDLPGPATRVFPIDTGKSRRQKLLSDSAILRIATALQESLHVKDVIGVFSNEARRILRDISFRYRNRERQILIEHGRNQIHRCSYELNLHGHHLGEVVFTRGRSLTERDQELLDALLCALLYPLRNALLYEQALTQALKDPLTGVKNRASLDAYLKQQITVTERHKNPLSVIMFDVDLFKSINDSFGHVAGDVVLRAVADVIVNCTRDSDVVSRYGGEEFVVILTNTEGDGAVYLAERVRVAVAALKLDGMANHGSVTISGGVAEFHQGDTPTDLLCRADKMLYGAKAKGRNRVQGASD